MIREFRWYLEQQLVKTQPRDPETARALMDMATRRFNYIKQQ